MVHSTRLRSRARMLGEMPRFGRARSRISGKMSANAIVTRYPQTDVLFRQLRIDRQREGYESVDELVWRRGVNERYFLEQLRELAAIFPGSHLIKD